MQSGLDTLATSGIVGLSPLDKGSMGDLFLLKMRDSGVINRAIFSLMIELKNNQSKMTFGGVDMENLASLGSSMTYHNTVTNLTKWWTLKMDNMTIGISKGNGEKELEFAFGKNTNIIS